MGGIRTRREKMSNQATTLIAFAVHQYKYKTALRRILPVVVVVEGQQIPWRLLLCLHTHWNRHQHHFASIVPPISHSDHWSYIQCTRMTLHDISHCMTTGYDLFSPSFFPVPTQPICSSSRNNSHEIQITPLSWPSFSYRTHVPLLP